jgi:tRNA(fMet)-specific endonuclease VapC
MLASVVSEGELLYGVGHAPAARRAVLERAVRQFLGTLAEIVPLTSEAAERYGSLKAHLAVRGTPIPSNDLWIAATALAEDMILVSDDAHFSKVPGLRLEDWTR